MAFKPKAKGQNPADLMGLLVNSKIQTENNALYQTIFGLITISQAYANATTSALERLDAKVDAIDVTEEAGIPPFFFMGSS